MCEKFSKTRTCPSQAKNIATCQKSALGVFQFLQSILNIQTYIYISEADPDPNQRGGRRGGRDLSGGAAGGAETISG